VICPTVWAKVAPYVVDVDLHLLHDGRKVQIRPIRADDAEWLRASHARLSPESRYRRFLGAKPALSEADARYLVEIDGADNVATHRLLERLSGGELAELRRGPITEVEVELQTRGGSRSGTPAMIAPCVGS
jgi:hypothetical protein